WRRKVSFLISRDTRQHSIRALWSRFSDGRLCFRRHRLPEIIQRELQARLQIDFRLPAQQFLRFADVRPALLGVILGQRLIADAALAAGYSQYFFRAIQNRELHWIADVHRQRLVRGHQAKETFDFIGDVTEAAGLAAIAGNRKRLAEQRLLSEGSY